MLRNVLEKLPRYLLAVFGFWLPAARKRRAERWLRCARTSQHSNSRIAATSSRET